MLTILLDYQCHIEIVESHPDTQHISRVCPDALLELVSRLGSDRKNTAQGIQHRTGSVVKEGTCFFDVCDLQALTDALEKKGFETRNDVKVKTNGNVRMDYMISQDKKFVAAQLFRFIPYTYEPASSVFYFTGDDASAFVHCLETSEF